MFAPIALGALVLSALPVEIHADGCPSATEVERALAPTLPVTTSMRGPDVVHIERRSGKLHIELASPDGAVVAERTLDRDGSCAELAAVAALVIASWQSDSHPEFASPEIEPRPAVAARPTGPPAPAPASQSPAAYDVGGGVVLSLMDSTDSLAWGGALHAQLVPRGTGPGLRLSFEGETTRSTGFEPGRANWRRSVLGGEAVWRWSIGPTTLDGHGGLTLGWLGANGEGFANGGQEATSFSPGVIAGARASWWMASYLAAYLEGAFIYWTRTQTLVALPSRQSEVPRLQGLLSIGASFGRSPARR